MQKLQSRVTGSGSITARRCDVSKPEDLKSSFEWIEETFGGVDVMVNNAGLFIHGNITDVGSHPLSEDELVSVLDVNVKGLMLCTRRAVASMRKRGVDRACKTGRFSKPVLNFRFSASKPGNRFFTGFDIT